MWYKSGMTTKTFKDVMENVREIEARRTGIYKLSNDERIAVGKGLAQADRGEFVPDELVAEADKRHGL